MSESASSEGKSWIRRLARYLWQDKHTAVLAVSGAVVATASMLVIPLLQRDVIDHVILARHSAQEVPLAIALLTAAGVNFVGMYVRRYFGSKIALDVQHRMRTELFGSLARLDSARQDEIHTGQLIGRSISDLTMVENLLEALPVALGNLLMLVASLMIMIVISPLLSLVAITVAPLLWIIAMRSKQKLFPASWHAQQQVGAVAGLVDQAVGGVRVVKGFGQERTELRRLERASADLFASRLRIIRLTARYTPALTALPPLGLIGVLALGGWLTIRGSLTLGTFLAFSTYIIQLNGPVWVLTNLATAGQQARASVLRVFELMDVRPIISESPSAAPLRPDANGITFDRVVFGYLPSQPLLHGFSLDVPAGEIVAVIGPSGSGKTTLSLLPSRFYDVTGGAVRIGGHDVREVTMASLRGAIGMVMEDSFLFSDTVRANIAYGRPSAPLQDVIEAARAAEADTFIRELPEGYDTVIGERGHTLSGGQRQRLALARALITDPRILILDDATSAVDSRIESSIHKTLRQMMRGRTTLIIARRRSTLRLANRIAVVSEDGLLVDVGTYDELNTRCGLFRALISGPGDEAMETGSGGIAPCENAPATIPEQTEPGITPQLWERSRVPGGAASRDGSAGAAKAPMHGMVGSIPPDPKLLAEVALLPSANDRPALSQPEIPDAAPGFMLRNLLRPLMAALAIGLLLDGLDTVARLALPALVRDGINSSLEQRSVQMVLAIALAGFAIVGADWLINIAETMVAGRNGERLLYLLRVRIFAHLQRLGLDYYERESSGRIITRIITDVDALSTFLQTGLVTMVSAAMTFCGVLGALLFINTRLGLYVLSIGPLLAAATITFRVKSSRAYAEARERVSVVNADLIENVAGLRVTQAFGREPENSARFAEHSFAYRTFQLRAQQYAALYFPSVQTLSTLAGTLILFLSISQVRQGTLSAGALIAYLLYLGMVFGPLLQLSQVFDGYQQAVVGLHRIKDLLRQHTSTPQADHPLPVIRLRGAIELRDVWFSYRPDLEPALKGITMTVAPGETIALVGQTGAGKSTIVKLIARFYDVTSGTVQVDGRDIRSLDLEAYRRRLGLIPQEAYLFSGTVRDAIAYARPSASPAEVEAAGRAVSAHTMIARLPGGYLHPVAERGRNLSEGQRQLIALARAQLAGPDILLLDEATAALDLFSEGLVYQATRQLAQTRTTIVVAHRLTTAARANRIAVLDHGRLAEFGTHTELLAADGLYAGLWRAFTRDAEAREPSR